MSARIAIRPSADDEFALILGSMKGKTIQEGSLLTEGHVYEIKENEDGALVLEHVGVSSLSSLRQPWLVENTGWCAEASWLINHHQAGLQTARERNDEEDVTSLSEYPGPMKSLVDRIETLIADHEYEAAKETLQELRNQQRVLTGTVSRLSTKIDTLQMLSEGH